MADTDVWGLGAIASPAATDRVPIATGTGAGGYSPRSDFAWRLSTGEFDVFGGNTAKTVIGIGSLSGDSNLGYQLKGTLSALPSSQTRGFIATGDSAIGTAGDLLIAPRSDAACAIWFLTGSGGATKRWGVSSSGHFQPASDNAYDVGTASFRGRTAYFGTGTINTSDAREKNSIGAVPDEWLDAWADVEWVRFKFNGGSRWHIGLVAQQVHEAFAAHGIDAFEIGLCCYDEWEAIEASEDGQAQAAGSRWGLRYTECEAMEVAYQRRIIAAQEARLAALEALITEGE